MPEPVSDSGNRLLVISADYRAYLELLRPQAPKDLPIRGCDSLQDGRRQARSCNIILGDPNLVAGVLEHADRLQWVQSSFAGVDALCRPGLRRDYQLTGVKHIFGPLISEYVFAYVLALERHLFEARRRQAQRRWQSTPYRSLRGQTLGVAGFGSIGRHLAQTGRHFDMDVVAYKRSPGTSELARRVFSGSEFADFLGGLDYLVLALPKTPETDYLIDAAALRLMQRDAVVINVGRGSTLVERDLQQALETGRIRAAVLDVFEREPLSADSPLWGLPNVFVTPHVAAVSFVPDIVRIFFDNYRRFVAGGSLSDRIDFQRGY